MKKLLLISFCIANILNAGPEEQALELWKKNVIKSIEATEKLQTPLTTYYHQLQSNSKPNTLNELKNTAQNKHDYFKNLTTSEFRKNIGKQVLKNGAITSVGVTGLLASGIFTAGLVGIGTPIVLLGGLFGDKDLSGGAFLSWILMSTGATSITTLSTLIALKYGKRTCGNISGLINTEQKRFEKQITSNYNLQKLEKLQKTISDKNL